MTNDTGGRIPQSSQALEGARLAHAALEAVITIDHHQRIVMINPAGLSMFGLTSKQALGLELGRLMPERFRKAHQSHVQQFMGSDEIERQMSQRSSLVGLRASGDEFPLEAAIFKSEVLLPSDPETGYYSFTDYNEDARISSPEDNLVIEKIGIRYFGGWSNQFSYKQWDFSFLFQFVKQRQSNYNSLMPLPGAMYNQPIEVLDVWSEDNPDGRYMPYTAGYNSDKNRLIGYFKSSTATISDASFIRLKNIQLSYRLPVNKYSKEVLFYVQGQNLLTLTNYFGLDPEFTLTGYLPPLKTLSFGVQLNF